MIILHIFAIYGLLTILMDGIKAYKAYKLKQTITNQFNELMNGGKK